MFALDWRPSDATLGWAQDVLDRHPRLPAILTTHHLVDADRSGAAELSAHGRRLWERLIARNDQIFLTLNGHYWPPGRTVLRFYGWLGDVRIVDRALPVRAFMLR